MNIRCNDIQLNMSELTLGRVATMHHLCRTQFKIFS